MRLPPPHRLGLPEQFTAWRLQQESAILSLVDSEVRFNGINAPTGTGKTLTALGLAQLLPRDERVLILTSTKQLQDQIRDTFTLLLRDVRGKRNYRCIAASPGGALAPANSDDAEDTGESVDTTFVSVEHGPCFSAGVECSLREGGCTWFDALRAARDARIVSSNYSKWISTVNYEDDLGRFDWLICDEAADAEQHLTDSLHIELRKHEVESLLHITWPAGREPGVGRTQIETWREWSRHNRSVVDAAMRTAEGQLKDVMSRSGRAPRELVGKVAALRRVVSAFTQLRTLRGEWVLDDLRVYGRVTGAVIDPLWPAPYAESLLFRGIPHVVLMGATLVEKHMDILGVPVEERQFTAYRSTFPVARRPVIFAKLDSHVAPSRLNYQTEQDESVRRKVAEVGDAIIHARGDRNGIVHTGSYKRCTYLVTYSRHRDTIITHGQNADSVRAAVARFKGAAGNPPAQLFSPSVTTGVDFPGSQAEWCWVPKLFFEDFNSALAKARCGVYPKYTDFKTANKLMQAAGRIVRAQWDQGETIITDQLFAWWPWARGNRELFAPHFLDAIRTVNGLPNPLPKLRPRSRGS